MTVYGAMNAAVSGMKAQSKSLGNISDNIANSQTTGYKRVDTSFAELVTLSNRSTHSPGGVIATPRYRHSIGGDISQTQISTNMGISGDGFFLVSKANSITPGSVSFDNEELFTRRGDFQMDKFGYLKNGGGYFLNGRRVLDQDTLNTSDINQPIRIETDVMEAKETSRINYNANLPANAPTVVNPDVSSTAVETTANPAVDPTEITTTYAGGFNEGDILTFTVNDVDFTYTVTAADAADAATGNLGTLQGNVDAAITADADIGALGLGGIVVAPVDTDGDATDDGITVTFTAAAFGDTLTVEDVNANAGANTVLSLANNDQDRLYQSGGSYSGGAVTIYNDLGTPSDIQLRWSRTGADGEWTLLARDPNAGTTPWVNLGVFGFTDGKPTTVDGAPFSGTLDIAGGTFGGFDNDITIDFTGLPSGAAEGDTNILLTQYHADTFEPYRLDQDGYEPGILTDVFINDFGYVVANYDNGRSKTLFQVPLATFDSPNDLGRLDGGAFKRTPESGDPLVTEAGQAGAGNIIASAVEQSNVDIADEFTKMIVTQRAYSANSRTVSTADQMLEEVVNLKR